MKPFVTRFLIRFIVNSSILSSEQNILELSKTSFHKNYPIFKITQFSEFSSKTRWEIKFFLWDCRWKAWFLTEIMRFRSKISPLLIENERFWSRFRQFLVKNVQLRSKIRPIWIEYQRFWSKFRPFSIKNVHFFLFSFWLLISQKFSTTTIFVIKTSFFSNFGFF